LEPSGPLQACNGTDLPLLPPGVNPTAVNKDIITISYNNNKIGDSFIIIIIVIIIISLWLNRAV
jgi:hypothetical protein